LWGTIVNIWVDADACPADIKELVFRASRRLTIPVYLVANRAMSVPASSLVTCVRVGKELDAADQYILHHVAPNDLVITADIPLAAAVVARHAVAIDPRGEVHTEANVPARLALRHLMQDLRTSGLVQGGPAPLSAVDRQKFAAALDRSLTKILQGQTTPGTQDAC
jgi:hypothetical protein